MISPDLVKETIDGVVLFPSAFGMTSIEPSGFTYAITEFVVPRSIPTMYSFFCHAHPPPTSILLLSL